MTRSDLIQDSCPRCGQPKNPPAELCQRCQRIANGKLPPTSVGNRNDIIGLSGGREESTITFRNTRTGAVRTLICHGHGVDAQINAGLAQLADDEGSNEDWVPECRSTPASILADLKGRKGPAAPLRRPA